MKNLFLVSMMFFCLEACAMGSKRPDYRQERKPQDKLWRPCEQGQVPEPVGKLCNQVCDKFKRGKCTHYKVNTKNFNDPNDFEFFRTGSFIMIDEDNL